MTGGGYERMMSGDPPSDAIWILSSTFIIFTMQSGFGLLESGSVTPKNEVNIMVKNAADVIFGGFTYWIFGYAFSFGEDEPNTNFFCGWGNFFVHVDNATDIGWVYSKFFFQASFATTATTIVSGAMAERIKLEAYILFSLLNTFVFCFPAHWVWGEYGWLAEMGVIDIAGAGPVHLVGGVTGLISTLMLKARHGRFDSDVPPQMGSPTNAILGMFMLWWGWLGFNCGSTFGISGSKWKLAARSAVATITASMAGGIVGLVFSYIVKRRKFDVPLMINGVLGSLVGITGYCALAHPWEGFVIGAVGALIGVTGDILLDHIRIDDPVGVVPVHCLAGIWSLLAVGFFARDDTYRDTMNIRTNDNGLFHGGGFHLLGIQLLAVVSIGGWTAIVSFMFLKLIDVTIGLRLPLEHELLGADIVEHGIGDIVYDKLNNKILKINGQILDDITGGADDHNREDVKARMARCTKRRRRKLSENQIIRARMSLNLNNTDSPSPTLRTYRRHSSQSILSDIARHPRFGVRRGSSAYGKRIDSPIRALEYLEACRDSGVFHISDNHVEVVQTPSTPEETPNTPEHVTSNDSSSRGSEMERSETMEGGVFNTSFELNEGRTDSPNLSAQKPFIISENGIGPLGNHSAKPSHHITEIAHIVINPSDDTTKL